MTSVDWLGILHPVLAVVIVYPLIGIVVRLAMQTRARRLKTLKCPPTVGREHSDLGRWLSASVVLLVLVALGLNMVNVIGYVKCKRDAGKKLKDFGGTVLARGLQAYTSAQTRMGEANAGMQRVPTSQPYVGPQP